MNGSELISDIISFLIIFVAILTTLSGAFKGGVKAPPPVPVRPPHPIPDVEKRITTGRRAKPVHREVHHEVHHEEVQYEEPKPVIEIVKPVRPIAKTRQMLIHYEVLSPPKAFRK